MTRTYENNRSAELLDAAAVRFADAGYHKTTIREIGDAAGMLPGSVYYHFPSKADLLLAVYDEGVERVGGAVDAALEGKVDPWDRLEAALGGHLTAILEASAYARVLLSVLPSDVPEAAARLRDARDRHEDRFRELVADLDGDLGVDPALFRLFMLGAANHAKVWFHPGSRRPVDIAAELVRVLRGSEASDRSSEPAGAS